MTTQKSNYCGFTLIEIAITLIVIGILATVITINLPRSTVNLNTQAELLANNIRYTQNLAMTKGERYRFKISTQTNSYSINNSTIYLDKQTSFGSVTNNLIIFNSNGIPYIDTKTPLKETATIALTAADGRTVIITIYPETGSVTYE